MDQYVGAQRKSAEYKLFSVESTGSFKANVRQMKQNQHNSLDFQVRVAGTFINKLLIATSLGLA